MTLKSVNNTVILNNESITALYNTVISVSLEEVMREKPNTLPHIRTEKIGGKN